MSRAATSLIAIRLRDAWANAIAAFEGRLVGLGLRGPPCVRRAAAHWRNGVTYVHAMGRRPSGASVQMPPVLRFEIGASAPEIGTAVLQSLAAYREGVSHPHARSLAAKARFLDFLRLLDARTNAEMMKGGKLVSVESTSDAIRLMPWRNAGARHGFTGMPLEAVLELPADASPGDLGKALAEAFARCG